MSFTTEYVTASSLSSSQNILLDSSIRDWVVLPLLIIMVEAGLLRHYLSLAMKPAEIKKIPHIEHRTKNALSRASRLRSGAASYLSKNIWEGRVRYWTTGNESMSLNGNNSLDPKGGTGYLQEELQWIEEEEDILKADSSKKASDDDMPDPMAMMGPMKGQFVFMAQNMVMMQGIGYFFSGYVLVKVPIPLTMGFKLMFQRGLDLSTLETSYVSSVSWYFLVMYGLRAFFKLVIEGDGNNQNDFREASMIMADLGCTMHAAGPVNKKFDAVQAIKSEIENLELSKHKSILDDADKRLLGKKFLMKKFTPSSKSGSNNPGYDIFGASSSKTKTSVRKVKSS